MATYIDRARTSVTSLIQSFDLAMWVYPPDVVVPDPLTNYRPITLTYDTNQQGAQVQVYFTASTSGFGTIPWTWQILADVSTFNGFGATATVTKILASGTGTAAQAPTGLSHSVGACVIEYTGSVDSTVYWDITTAAFGGVGSEYPDTTYNCYENSTVGGTAFAQIVINGQTAISTGAIGSALPLSFGVALGVQYENNTAVSKTFTSGTFILNGVSIASSVPTFTHTYGNHPQTSTAVVHTALGYTDAFGYMWSGLNESSLSFRMKRDIMLKGRVRAFDKAYPDLLSARITGFDNGTLGYRDVAVTAGVFDETDTFIDYTMLSTLTDADVSQSPDTKVESSNTVPALVKADISAASLTTWGDDSTNTKLLLRGWSFPGASVVQADTAGVSTGLVTSTRTFAGAGVALNSYRYLRVQLKTTTGTTETGTLTITTQPNSVLKTFPITATTTSFVEFIYDLCIPNNATQSIDETDNPYPRMNSADVNNVNQYVDGDYYGINRATIISIDNVNMVMGDIYAIFISPYVSYTKGFWCPTYTWYKQRFTTLAGYTSYTNRLYQGDADGNTQSEEGWAVWDSAGLYTLSTITQFVASMNAVDSTVTRHLGYTASAVTPNSTPTYIVNGYASSVTGFAYWLGGTTFTRVGGSADIKNWVEIDQSADGPYSTVTAQTYFRSVNGNFPPDIFDVFTQDNVAAQYVSIGCVSYQRGRSHGLVVSPSLLPEIGANVNLLLDSDGSNRGVGNSDSLGRYYTGLPMGLGMKNHNTVCLTLDSLDPDPLYTDKQYRFTFKQPGVAGTMLSADKDAIYRNYYATLSGNTISIWQAANPLASGYVQTITPITTAVEGTLRGLELDDLIGLKLAIRTTGGNIESVYTTDGGTTTVSTVINSSGTRPSFCIDPLGREIYIWRTSGSDIESKILDTSGVVLMTVTVVVTGSVADSAIDIYERLDDLYILYTHSTNGITVVRSTDGGRTYT